MGVGSYSKYQVSAPTDVDLGILDSLPDNVKEQFDKYATAQNNLIDELKEKHEKLLVDSGQKQFEVEKQLESVTTKYTTESQTSAKLKQQLSDIEKRYDNASHQVHELQSKHFAANKRCDLLEQTNRQLSAQRDDLVSAVEKKTSENDSLTENWKEISEKMNVSNRNRIEALAKYEEAKSRELAAQHQEQRMRQEVDNLQHRNQWLQREIQEKTDQLMSSRKDQAATILELQSALEEKSDEVVQLQDMVDSFKLRQEGQNKAIESYLEKLAQAQENQTQMDEQYRAEIQSQERLIEIYKTTASQKEKRVEELMPAVEEMRNLLKEAAQDRADLEREKDVENKHLSEQIKDRDEQILQMKKELGDANDLIEAMRKKGVLPPTEENIEALSPAAAAASRLLKSGMTLTQIYSEYVQASEDLLLERSEKERLSEHLDQILQEIEQKAPILKKQREDYEQALETISLLTGQLDTAMVECQKLQLHSDECLRRKNEVSRENLRLQQTSVDLGQQVRMLLKELEEARGTVVSMRNHDNVSSLEVSSTSQVISDNLVTFKSIEELQEQNQRLLEVVRELGEQREREEAESTEHRVQELKQELEGALAEVGEMKAARQRQAEMVESIVRQRDMYKLMLSQTGDQSQVDASPQRFSTPMAGFMSPAAGPSVASPITGATPQARDSAPPPITPSNQALDETKTALKELQEDFSVYRREKGENERILNEQIDKLRTETSEMRVLNAKLSSQLEFSSERYKVLQSNIEGYKKEISALRDKVQKLTASNAKHEQGNMTLRQELLVTQERSARAEAQCQSLTVEREMLKATEARLLQERENMMAEQRSRDMLMVNLQSIQNNLDRSEFETKTKYTQKIEGLEKSNATLQRRLDGLHEEQHRRSAALEKQLADTRAELDRERSDNRGSSEQLKQANSRVKALEHQLAEASEKLVTASHQGTAHSPELLEEIKDLKAKLADANAEIKAITAQREKHRKEAEQYKSIADSIELNLKEQNEISRQLEQAVTSQLDDAKQVQAELEGRIAGLEEARAALEKERDVLQADIDRLSQGNQHLGVNQQRQVEGLQREIQRLTEERDIGRDNEAAARSDCETQAQLARDAREMYQRELLQHAADVSALTAAREELAGYEKRLRNAQEETVAAQNTLEASQVSWERQEQALKATRSALETKVTELQNQNRLVHEELEAVSQKMLKLQRSTERDAQEQRALEDSMSHTDEERSAEQLLEVVRFIRKEKDIAEARLDIVQAEANRLKQQTNYLQKQLTDTTESLNEERQKSQATMQTAAQHADLVRKVEMLNLLQDSNRMLREEKDRMAEQITELETKVRGLEQSMVPLQESKIYLQGQYDAVEIERKTLQAEVQRWRARTNHLIEQCNKADPEEFKRMMAERDDLKKKLSGSTEEIQKHKAEISKISNQLNVAQTELTNSNETIERLDGEIAELKADIDTRTKDQEEKLKTIAQLRKIGRKYRMQAEEVQKELDDLKSSNPTQKLEEAHQAKTKELEEALKKTEAGLMMITEKLASSESEKAAALTAKASLEEQVNKLNTELTQEKETNKHHTDTVNKLKEEQDKKQAQSRNILTTAKNKIFSQRGEIDKLTAERNELKSQNAALQAKTTESEAQTSALRSQLENKISQMERELESRAVASTTDSSALTQEVEALKKKNTELTAKLQQLQKRLESLQTPQATAAARPKVSASATDRPGPSSGEAVKTANIKPMTTPTTSSRPIQSALVQPVRSTATDRFRASVSPMATTTAASTPTATVMPTTVTVQDSDSGHVSAHSQMSPQHLQMSSQTRPTQQVQPVTQRVDDSQEEQSDVPAQMQSQESLPSESSVIADDPAVPSTSVPSGVTPHPSSGVSSGAAAAGPTSGKRLRDDADTSDEPGTSSLKRRKSQGRELTETEEPSTASGSEVVPSQSELREPLSEVVHVEPSAQPSTQQQSVVPQREEQPQTEQQMVAVTPQVRLDFPEDPLALESGASEVEAFEEEPQTEDLTQDTTEQPVAEVVEDIPAYEEVGDSPGDGEDEGDEGVGSDPPAESNSMEAPSTDTFEPAVDDDADTEAVVIIDDLEEPQDEEEEDKDLDEMEEYDEEEDPQEGMQESYDEEDEEMDEGSVEPMQAEDDDDVILVDDEPSPEEAVMEAPSEEPQAGSSQSPAAQLTVPQVTAGRGQVPQLSRLASQQDRLMAMGRAQQPPPFSFGEQGGFDVGDDGIVPSTPTLLVPRRHDDFAQAVSSPQIQRRFVFGSGADTGMQPPEFGRLETQGALGVDDIRMDLTQFDDASGQGRNVPTVQTTPTISVTEPSPPRDSDQQTPAIAPSQTTAATDGSELELQATQQPEATDSPNSQVDVLEEGQGEAKDIASLGGGDVKDQGDGLQPGTSDDRDPDKPNDDDKSDLASGSSQRPRIQRIVWDRPTGSGAPAPVMQATPQPQQSLSQGQVQAQRKPQTRFRGHARGQGFSRMQRPMYRGSGSPQQGTQRGRGVRGNRRPYQQQQQRQPPF